jgi:hypothetical protein
MAQSHMAHGHLHHNTNNYLPRQHLPHYHLAKHQRTLALGTTLLGWSPDNYHLAKHQRTLARGTTLLGTSPDKLPPGRTPAHTNTWHDTAWYVVPLAFESADTLAMLLKQRCCNGRSRSGFRTWQR